MSSATSSSNIPYKFALKCQNHAQEEDNEVIIVNLDQVRNKDYSRLACVVC